jgi:type IV secretory pathway TraG/TraD family ATPase VirD4
MMYAVIALLLLAGACWLWHKMTKHVARNRVRSFRTRLHLRLRPGHGFATAFELWLRFGRFAMWRKSRRIRPELGAWQRIRHVGEHSAMLGRAQRGQAIRVSGEEHVILTAAPRTGKTGALGAMLTRHAGPAVVTSSKPDLALETSAIRAMFGPVEVLNPAGLGGIASTFSIDIIDGCTDIATCVRRADAIASAVSMKGSDNGDYFAAKCSSYLRALFLAAGIVGGDARLVGNWVFGSAQPAERILVAAGHAKWAAELGELRGAAEKSAATTKSLMTRAMQFLNIPNLADAVLPGDFDIAEFIRDNGTLYLVADSGSEENPLAPLFSLIVTEITYVASVIGSKMPGARLSPRLGLYLDEVCQVCPIPLPGILSDAGGRGIQVVTVVHGFASLADRYGENGAQTVMNTSGCKVWLGGSSETRTLEMIAKLAGQFSRTRKGQEHDTDHDVITSAMARSLPPGWAIVISGPNAPVVARMERYWTLAEHKHARRNGGTVATLQPVSVPLQAVQVPERPAVEAFEDVPDPLRSMLGEAAMTENAWGAV